jgi:hypothetical protein
MNVSHKQCASRFAVLLAVLVLMFAPQTSWSQLNSNTAGVVLTATLLESLTVVALPSAVNFDLAPGGEALGSSPVTITTTWILGATRTTVNLHASFSSSTVALTDGSSHNIPSANVFGQVTTGSPTSFTAFTQTGPFGAAGAALKLYIQGINVSNLTSTRSDTLNLKIDLTAGPSLPAGVYVGTLNIQAQAL